MKIFISKSGKKIIFRPLRQSDLKTVYTWVKAVEKEDTFITLNAAEPVTLKDEKYYFKDLFKKTKQKKLVKMAVFDGKKYLGSCDIEKLGKRQGHVGIFGITLSKGYRHQGIGLKLAEDTVKLAQQRLGIRQIILSCFANNKIGISFYQKLGFKLYSRHPQAIFYKGKYIDAIWFYKNI